MMEFIGIVLIARLLPESEIPRKEYAGTIIMAVTEIAKKIRKILLCTKGDSTHFN
jgi:hypothetical protein